MKRRVPLREPVPEYMRNRVTLPPVSTPAMDAMSSALASSFAGCKCIGVVRVKWGPADAERMVSVELYDIPGAPDVVGAWHPKEGCSAWPRGWIEHRDIAKPPAKPRNKGLPLPRIHLRDRTPVRVQVKPKRKKRRVRSRMEGGN